MKRLSIIFISLILVFSSITPALAAGQDREIIWHQETPLGNGLIMIDEVSVQSQTRSTNKDYTRTKVISDGNKTLAIICLYGVFRYDGKTVSVVAKSVTQADTYEGWSYKQNSLTSSGGTIALDAKLTKLFVASIPVDMTLSCDKDGNISYT